MAVLENVTRPVKETLEVLHWDACPNGPDPLRTAFLENGSYEDSSYEYIENWLDDNIASKQPNLFLSRNPFVNWVIALSFDGKCSE